MNAKAIKDVFGDIGLNNMDNPNIKFDVTEEKIEYTLKRGIKIGEKLLATITLEEPNAKQMSKLKFATDGTFAMSQGIEMIIACSGMFETEVGLIKAKDIMKLVELATCFFA